MINPQQIQPHMPVVGSENRMLGKVDHVEGKSLKLTKDDKGQHHYIPLDWIKNVDDKVHVDRPGTEVMKQWTTGPSGNAE
jgi:hypothetical protein